MDPIWTEPAVAEIEKRRLRGHVARGRGQGPPLLFGAVFLVMGLSLAAVTFGLWPVAEPPAEGIPTLAARWISVGFAACGLYLLSWTLATRRRLHLGRALAREGAAWRVDHPWHPLGRLRGDGVRALRRQALGMALLVAFLVPLHLVFVPTLLPGADGFGAFAWVPALVLGLFDLVLLIGIGDLVARALRLHRFGTARLECGHVPLRLGQEVGLELVVPPALGSGQEISARLRCVTEIFLHRGRGSDSEIEQVSYVLYEATQADQVGNDGRVRFAFRLPGTEEALGNDLVSDPPRYWEVVLSASLPGLDYDETFLLPVYGSP